MDQLNPFQSFNRNWLAILFSFLLSISFFTPAIAQCDLTLTPANITNTTCGGNAGSFQVQVTGIVAPYQYRLLKEISGSFVEQEVGTLLAGSPTFVGLSGGRYKVELNKDGTCTGNVTVDITESALTLTPANVNYPSCGGNNGSFVVQASGIVAPYQYRLLKETNGNFVVQEMGTLLAGNPTFIGLTGGTYKVEIEKGGTCSGSVTVPLPESNLALNSANVTNPSCGGNDGSFVIQADGITAPYQYRLLKETNGSFVVQEMGTLLAGNLTFIGLTGGTYKVEIEKGGTCSGNITVALPQAALTLTPSNINPPVCGGNDGSFVVQASGIKAPYKYRLLKEVNGNFEVQESGTLIAGNPTFVGLTGGVYKLEVEKNGICSGSVIVNLNCETIGTEGCGTGYWKNNKGAWPTTGYTRTQTVEAVFNVPDPYGLDNITLQQALESTGGSGTVGAAKILLRAAVAALLNAAHPDVDYPRSSQQIISSTNTALASGNRNSMLQLATTFDTFNNLKCTLSASKTMASFPGRTSSELTEGSSALNLKAMPNPSAGAFTVLVESNSKEKIYLNVMDMNGRVIERMERMPSATTFRFGENYTPGMYIVEMIQGKNRKQVKLVKTR